MLVVVDIKTSREKSCRPKRVCIKIIDTSTIITYNKSTKNHTIFSAERGVLYVSCKKHGC